jgi:serine protease Do
MRRHRSACERQPPDLALLKINAKGLKPLLLGDSSKVRQGDPVVAMGAPEGLGFSIVQGVLSATRDIDGQEMLQVAVPIEKGNSGGPLLDMQGHVLGLLTLKSLKTDNLGFAMPVNELKKLIETPNPVPMSRWLTIGVLNSKLWKTHLGAQWTQHAGVIRSEFPGEGFGGRALCLSTQKVPEGTFEIATTVRWMTNPAPPVWPSAPTAATSTTASILPAASCASRASTDPDVYSWTILADVPSDAYKAGDWNTLRVRVEPERIVCFVNGEQVIESKDTGLRGGSAGLCKFSTTVAEFRGFRIGADLAEKPLQPELASQISLKGRTVCRRRQHHRSDARRSSRKSRRRTACARRAAQAGSKKRPSSCVSSNTSCTAVR